MHLIAELLTRLFRGCRAAVLELFGHEQLVTRADFDRIRRGHLEMVADFNDIFSKLNTLAARLARAEKDRVKRELALAPEDHNQHQEDEDGEDDRAALWRRAAALGGGKAAGQLEVFREDAGPEGGAAEGRAAG